VAELDLSMENDQATLGPIARQVVAAHPKQAAAYRKGKRGLLGFFVGQVMTATGGRAEPKLASALLAAELGDSEEAIPAPRNGQRRKKKKA
jgi:aspartyl-tRNA(Asn)/glutamyl-tRNA(Gln) amidotransferase subunit B